MGSKDVCAGVMAKRRDFPSLRCELPPEPPKALHHAQPKISYKNVIVALLAVTVCLIFLILDKSHVVTKLSPLRSFHAFKSDDLNAQKINDDRDELDILLKKASMENEKTVIITSINEAWAKPSTMFDLFLESLNNGIETQGFLQHLVVVTFDQVAHSRCLTLHRYCFALTTEGVDFSGHLPYLSDDYLKMMWRRMDFLLSVLEKGFNFIFTDVDVMWLRNPFERLNPNVDFQMACDVYGDNSTNRRNYANGGFLYVKSNPRSIQFYKYWISKQVEYPGKHDQDVFNEIKFDSRVNATGLEIRFLDTAYFGGFCEHTQHLDTVVTMHAVCCMSFQKKMIAIEYVLSNWKKYMRDVRENKNDSSLSTRLWRDGNFKRCRGYSGKFLAAMKEYILFDNKPNPIDLLI